MLYVQTLTAKWQFQNSTYVIHVTLEVAGHTVLDEWTDHQGAVAVADGSWEQTYHTVECTLVDDTSLYSVFIVFTIATVYLV